MPIKTYSPSVNIVRDSESHLDYIPTPNAQRIYNQIERQFEQGIRSFTVIGSYGTGKSSFFWAFEKQLRGQQTYFPTSNDVFKSYKNVRFVRLVGSYVSFASAIAEAFDLSAEYAHETIIKNLDFEFSQLRNEQTLLVIEIDEFGKFLEHASKTNPEKEIYFIQQVAELINDANKDVLFLAALHQNFQSYAYHLKRAQKEEWQKVKGRFKELTFNEPVEQLLEIASIYLSNDESFNNESTPIDEELVQTIRKANIFSLKNELTFDLAKNLYPLDILTAGVLAQSLQIYGQNERSLFTFLKSYEQFGLRHYDEERNPYFNISCLYAYLIYNYYSFLSTKYNPHYLQWNSIRDAVDRVESAFDDATVIDAKRLVQIIGLLQLFGNQGATIDDNFLTTYAEKAAGIANAPKLLQQLEQKKIIVYKRFKNQFALAAATDLDIELALEQAGEKIDQSVEIVPYLQRYVKSQYIPAKADFYKKGTPRYFEIKISDRPITEHPKDEKDGYINLIFSEKLKPEEIQETSGNNESAILYGLILDVEKFKEQIFSIERIRLVKGENRNDQVAWRELDELLSSSLEELQFLVQECIAGRLQNVHWFHNGDPVVIKDEGTLNRRLTEICETQYPYTPVFRNELVNKHKISGTITRARRILFEQILHHAHEEDLGFPKDKFPAEKTIYLSLLKDTEIHRPSEEAWELGPPKESSFDPLWQECERFLESAKQSKKEVAELIHLLSQPPFKLKQGLIDFWVPLFLIIKQDDYALFEGQKYIPNLSSKSIDLILKKPQNYKIKTFDVDGVKLDLFNKYRSMLNQATTTSLTNDNFVETVRPFLIFYGQLPEYTKRTDRLSEEAKLFREAIAKAKEPEETFFETLPSAFGVDIDSLRESKERLEEYVTNIHRAIRELRTNLANLIDRVEQFYLDKLGYQGDSFETYKKKLQKRYSKLNPDLLLPYQKTFYMRINSQIDDRKAWISSLVQAVLGKQIESIRDSDESKIYNKLLNVTHELDNLLDLHDIENKTNEKNLFKIQILDKSGKHNERVIEVPKHRERQVEDGTKRVREHLTKDHDLNIEILAKLLKEHLNNE